MKKGPDKSAIVYSRSRFYWHAYTLFLIDISWQLMNKIQDLDTLLTEILIRALKWLEMPLSGGLKKGSSKMMRGQKPWYKNWKIWLVIILILYIMGSANKPKTIENETEPVEWQQTQESEEVPKEEEQDTENQMDSEMKSYAGKPVGEVALPLYDSGRLSSMILGPTGATIWGPSDAHNTRDAIQNLADQGYIVTEAKSSDGQSVELVIDTTANVMSEQYSQQLLLAQGMASSSFEKLAPYGGEVTGWVQTPRTEDGKSWYGIAEAKVKNQYGVEMSGEVKVYGTIDGDTVTLSGFDTLD